jgi:hypothetical protein
MKNVAFISASTRALFTTLVLCVAASSHAQTQADYDRAKANYTTAQLEADALCGEASIVWGGDAAAIEKGWFDVRNEFYDKKPGGTENLTYNRSKSDIMIAGMRVAGVTNGGSLSGVAIGFEEAPETVFSKLPMNPKMIKTAEYKTEGITRWTQTKPVPRLTALSYKNFTLVSCERGENFKPKFR